jgi:hypothetical protein
VPPAMKKVRYPPGSVSYKPIIMVDNFYSMLTFTLVLVCREQGFIYRRNQAKRSYRSDLEVVKARVQGRRKPCKNQAYYKTS